MTHLANEQQLRGGHGELFPFFFQEFYGAAGVFDFIRAEQQRGVRPGPVG